MQAWQATVQNEQGNVVFNPSVTVYLEDGVTVASIFNEDGSPKENPFIGSLEGFVQFWANPGVYKVLGANGSDLTELWEVSLTDYDRYGSYADFIGSYIPGRVVTASAVVSGTKVSWARDPSGPIGPTADGGMWSPADGVTSLLHFGGEPTVGFDNAAAITAALSYADVVNFFGDANYEIASPLTIPNGKTIRYNGAGRITVVSGGSLTNNGNDEYFGPLTDADTPFGGSWTTYQKISSVDKTTNAGSRMTTVIRKTSTGSGENGPGRSDNALMVYANKEDYLTSEVQGEIDSLRVVLRQGKLGDASAVLVNAHRVDDGVSPYGLTSFEAQPALVDSAGVKLKEMKATVGTWQQATDLRGGGMGFMCRPQTGFSVSHGLCVLGLDATPGTGFETAIEASATLSANDTYFQVTGDLHADGSGRIRMSTGSQTRPSLAPVGNLSSGIWWPQNNVVAVTNNGANRLIVGNGVRVGSGTDPGAGNLNVEGAISSGGAVVIDGFQGVRFRGYGMPSISDAAHAVNTTDKVAGKAIFDTANGRVLVATGSAPTDPWNLMTGTVAVNPS